MSLSKNPIELESKTTLISESDDTISPNFYSRVFIMRDYSTDAQTIKFTTLAPIQLIQDMAVDEQVWRGMIDKINLMCEVANRLSMSTFCENVTYFFTCYLLLPCRPSLYEQQLKKVQNYIGEMNQNYFHERGLHIKNPAICGFRHMEVLIIDNEFCTQTMPALFIMPPVTPKV